MSRDIADIRTLALVLRRTNYGEADRILNLITPGGKVSAMVRGARKAKSRLAGGVEMFMLTELNLHFGRSEIATVTSAKMVKYYGAILADYSRMELASMILRRIAGAAEDAEGPEFFAIAHECMEGLDGGADLGLVESWFLVRLLKVLGEEVNLYRDINGGKLNAELRYDYNVAEGAFCENVHGEYGVDEIKLLRFMTTMPLEIVMRVRGSEKCLPGILQLTRLVSKMM